MLDHQEQSHLVKGIDTTPQQLNALQSGHSKPDINTLTLLDSYSEVKQVRRLAVKKLKDMMQNQATQSTLDPTDALQDVLLELVGLD